jgi:regulator of protease activity HflC (stomatin/prohibitin superfamily)
MNTPQLPANDGNWEHPAHCASGWAILPLWLVACIVFGLMAAASPKPLGIIGLVIALFISRGFVILQPNMASVLTFFGRYAGTIRADGFFWYNPFCSGHKISLRVVNLNTAQLKVNDRAGNPIEVAAVIAWRVRDTAKALFDVENYATFLSIQSESALRQVVSTRYYDGDTQGQQSLRGDLEAVSRLLKETIQEHVELAGLEVIEAKFAHLAYAQEIASVMLRRQQAEAIIAARQRIVEGAVGMVRLAVDSLEREQVVTLKDEDRVRLVTNLMTVLVSETETHPVLSVGKD